MKKENFYYKKFVKDIIILLKLKSLIYKKKYIYNINIFNYECCQF